MPLQSSEVVINHFLVYSVTVFNYTFYLKVITSYLREVKDVVDIVGVDRLTGTSIRIGAANDIADHADGGIYHSIMAGGWDCEDISRAFCYLMSLKGPMIVSAKILAGWPRARGKQGSCPSLDPITHLLDSYKDTRFDNFVVSLLNLTALPDDFHNYPNCRMRFFIDAIVASLLMYLPSRMKDVGEAHICVSHIFERGRHFQITRNSLLQYGHLISKHWMNARETFQVTSHGSSVPDLQLQQANMERMNSLHFMASDGRCEIAKLKTEVESLRSQISSLVDVVTKLTGTIQDNSVSISSCCTTGSSSHPMVSSSVPSASGSNIVNVYDDNVGNSDFHQNGQENENSRNALDLLMAPENRADSSVQFSSAKGLTIESFIFQIKICARQPPQLTVSSELKSDLSRIYKLVYEYATEEQRIELDKLPPSTVSIEWQPFEQNLRVLCAAVAENVAINISNAKATTLESTDPSTTTSTEKPKPKRKNLVSVYAKEAKQMSITM